MQNRAAFAAQESAPGTGRGCGPASFPNGYEAAGIEFSGVCPADSRPCFASDSDAGRSPRARSSARGLYSGRPLARFGSPSRHFVLPSAASICGIFGAFTPP